MAVSTFALESTSPVAMSTAQERRTTCSPRLKTLVCVQPIGRFAPPPAACR